MNAAMLPAACNEIATLIERGDFALAERHAQNALQTLSAHAEIWRLLGIAQFQSGRIEAAARALEQAARLAPDSIEVQCNLATLETRRGDAEKAKDRLERALALAPDHIAALIQLGRLRHRCGDHAGAAQCFERGARANPQRAEIWFALAGTSIALHAWAAAQSHVHRGLSLAPRSAEGWYLLGFLHERQGRLADAVPPYRKSLELGPGAQAAHNLALVLDRLGDPQAGARLLEYALRLDPDMVEALSQLAYAKRQLCDWDGLPELSFRVLAAVDAGKPGAGPFALLAEASTPAQQRHCARTFAQRLGGTVARPDASRPALLDSQPAHWRVGFVSSGFNEHATGLLLVEMIERLRETDLVAIAFATTPGDVSEWRRRLERGFVEFHDVAGQSAEAIAQRVRDARIDILIDLDGYCMDSMPRLFALRPAAIQVNYLAYPGSLGAPWCDYLIADACVIDSAQRAFYDEKIACLPRCYQPIDTTRRVREPPARAALGLPERTSPDRGFVYCCFNAHWKIAPHGFARWMRILAAVPGSVLWLLDERPGTGAVARLRREASKAGIDPQRLVFAPKAEHASYLARYRHADLFLDTNPYNAHTTASDALFAGCPVLTRPGDTFASRVAASLDRQLGLDELIVADDEAYIALAIALARQPDRLAALRARLHDPAVRMKLFDMRAYAKDFAALLTRMADRARAGHPPQDISL